MRLQNYKFINEDILLDDLWEDYPLIDDEVVNNYEAAYDIIRGVDSTLSGVSNYIIIDGEYDGMRLFQGVHEITHLMGMESGNVARLPRRDSREGLTVVGFKPDYDRYGPIKIIDVISNVQVSKIIPFDPIRGYFDPQASKEIDFVGEDPMRFGSESQLGESTWMDPKVGYIWLDSGTVGYRPYNLSHQYSNITKQLMDWGKPAEWADFRVYQWTRSEEHPEDYDNAATMQEGDISIPMDKRASGKAKRTIFYDGAPIRSGDLSLSFWRGQYDSSSPDNTIEFNKFMRYSIPDDERSPSAPINIYVNGKFLKTSNYSDLDRDLSTTSVRDHIYLERSLIEPDTGDEYVWVDRQIDYLERDELYRDGTKKTYYYFWAEDKKIAQYGKELSLFDIRRRYISPDHPYFFFNGFSYDNDPNGMDKYARMYIRNIRKFVTEDNRFKLQIPSNMLIAENLRKGGRVTKDIFQTEIRKYVTGELLYDTKEEWQLFNESNFTKIPKELLWDLLTEAIMGVEIESVGGEHVTLPYPKFSRFDIKRGRDTSYGLGKGQVINDSESIRKIINDMLMQVDSDGRSGYTKSEILQFVKWGDVDEIMTTMDFLYNEMPTSTVNSIFISVVKDAKSKKYDMSEIMKTSYIQNRGKFVLRTGEDNA